MASCNSLSGIRISSGTLQTSAQRIGELGAQGLVNVPEDFKFTPLVNSTFVVSATKIRHVRASFKVTNNTGQPLTGLTFLPVVKTSGNGTPFSSVTYYDGSDASSKAGILTATAAKTYDLGTEQASVDPAASPFTMGLDVSALTAPASVASIKDYGWAVGSDLAPGATTTVTFAVDFPVDAAGPSKDPFGFSLLLTAAQPEPTLASAVQQYDAVTKTFGNYTRLVTLNGRSLPAYYDVSRNAVLCSFDADVVLSNRSDAAHPNRTRVEVKTLGAHTLEVYAGSACPAAAGTPLKTQTVTGVAPQVRVQPLASFETHSLALKADGTVQSWGNNIVGQLGHGASGPDAYPNPTAVSNLMDVVSIAGGASHSLALKMGGTVQGWGANNFGQLGDGTQTNSPTPVSVSGLTDVMSIAGGASHSLALKSDGTVQSWGNNNYGQLGTGTSIRRSTTPVSVSGLTDVVSIASGRYHGLALKANGTVKGWGFNIDGQLGEGTNINRNAPYSVVGLTDVVSIASGASHSLALKADGTVQSWGSNSFGQLGDGTSTKRSLPVSVLGLTDVVGIVGGAFHSLALKADGTVQSWGRNDLGQLGDGTQTNSPTPVSVSGLMDVVSVASGSNHSLALKADGAVQSWGWNNLGQLGDGTTTDRTTPTSVSISGVAQPTP